MFRNYLKIAVRNLWHQKVYTLITMVGLAMAMAACILVFLFVRQEFSYDQYHEHAESIYRLNWWVTNGDQRRGYALVGSSLAPAIQEALPEVIRAVRVYTPLPTLIRIEGHLFEEQFALADPAILKMFDIPLVAGNQATALADPHSIIISQSVAKKYFPDRNPIGQVIPIKTELGKFLDCTVSGVMEDIPSNSHLKFDILASFEMMKQYSMGYAYGNRNFALVYTYLQLVPAVSVDQVQQKLDTFFQTSFKRPVKPGTYFLEPLRALHFGPEYFGDLGDRSNSQYSYYLIVLAGFVLLVAGINFIVLTTARSLSRTREVGTRKVLGAHRRQIVGQFLTETLVLAGLAIFLGLFLCEIFLPAFNTFTGKQLALHLLGDYDLWIFLLGLLGMVTLGVGAYPAFFMSSFQPAAVLKGMWFGRLTASSIRKILVAFQFALAILFITGTLVLVKQLRYIQHKDLGFDPKNLVFTLVYQMKPSPEAYKEALLRNPHILDVAFCGSTPGERSVFVKVTSGNASDEQAQNMDIVPVGLNYFKTIGMSFVAGRSFSENNPSEANQTVVLNESAVRTLGWQDPVGKTIRIADYQNADSTPKTVVGVVQDIHYTSLHQTIPPRVYFYDTAYSPRAVIRLSGFDVPGTMAFIEQQWHKFVPEGVFEPYFIEDRITQQYAAERKAGRAVETMATLLVFLSCLGLFGLARFTVEKRTKEIGIRKVLGASLTQIVTVISNEFLHWILVANLVAWPVVYLLARRWLRNFAYHITLGPGLFLLGGAIALLVAGISIGIPALKAARSNPVEALRYE